MGSTTMVCTSPICSSCIWLLGDLIAEKAAFAVIGGSFLGYRFQTGHLWAEDDLQIYSVLQSRMLVFYFQIWKL